MVYYVMNVAEYWQYSPWSGTSNLFEYTCKAKSVQEAVDKAIKFAKEEIGILNPVVTGVETKRTKRYTEKE